MRRTFNLVLVLALFIISDQPFSTDVTAKGLDVKLTNLVRSNEQGISFDVQIDGRSLDIESVLSGGQRFSKVSIPGLGKTFTPGAPELPYIVETVAVPFGIELQITVTPGKAISRYLTSDVMPAASRAQEMLLSELGEDALTKTIPQYELNRDAEIYNNNAPFPGVLGSISNEGILRQQRVAGISLFPVQYLPASREIIVYENLHVELRFVGVPRIAYQIPQSDSAFFELSLQRSLLNYHSSKAWRIPDPDAGITQSTEKTSLLADAGTMTWKPPSPGWRIKVREDAFYQITYEELLSAGVNFDLFDPSSFQVFYQGNEIAILVDDKADSSFDPGDRIIFYGQAIKDKYTLDNVYWLTYGQGTGLRMSARDVAPASGVFSESYLASLHLEEDLRYVPNFQSEDDADHFLWNFVRAVDGPASWSKNISLTAPFDGSGRLKLKLLGYSQSATIEPDHHAIIKINSQIVEDVTWDGKTWIEVDVSLPAGTFIAGENILELLLPCDTGAGIDVVYVDWMDLAYERQFLSEVDQLAFDYDEAGIWKFQVKGFSNNELLLFDISDPRLAIALEGFEVHEAGSNYDMFYEDEVIDKNKYWASSQSTLLSVESIEADIPSDLRSLDNRADYLLITHADFLDQAFLLQDFHNDQGISSKVVDIQDIYDEFAFGIEGAVPIKDFIAYAYNNWTEPAPSFVLLIGDGHYDPKNNLGFGRTSFLPPYLAVVDPVIGETGADNRYVTVAGEDTLPDLMLGRFAVNNIDEAAAFVEKVVSYEISPEPGDWKRKVLAVADDPDLASDFPETSDELLECCLPDYYESEKVYFMDTHLTVDSAKAAIIDGINAGKLLVNYIGHAGYSQWTHDAIFTSFDMPLLTNYQKYPIILSMTCYEGYYINPQAPGTNYEALAEAITKSDGKGAVASWSPVGTGVTTGHDYLNRGFLNALLKDGVSTIGEATIAAKLNLWASNGHLDLIDTYLLFGDPATNMLRILTAVNDSFSMNEDEVLTVSADHGLMINDINPYDQTISASLVEDVSHGLLSFSPDGSFVYTPHPDYYGNDSFTYVISDGLDISNTATVTIFVNPINDPPIAFDQSITTSMDESVDIILSAIDDGSSSPDAVTPRASLFKSNGIDNANLIFNIQTNPSNGILSGIAPDLVYTPNSGFIGIDSFTFLANDGTYDSNIATVTIQVSSEFVIFIPLAQK